MNNFKDRLMNNKKLIIAGIAVLAVVIAVICIAVSSGSKNTAKNNPGKNTTNQEEIILPDVLMPKDSSYVTEKTDTSITVEGYITTPSEENPVPDSLDDPEFEYPTETVSYIYKSHDYEFDKDGNLFIEIEYEKTTDMGISTEFNITVEDEKLAESPAVFITCNGYEHKVWQR